MPRDYDTTGIEHYEIASFTFQCGITLPLQVAYRRYNPSANKAILIPTCYGGLINNTFAFTSVLASYHIIVVAMLGAGESSSPSNDPNFPSSLSYIDCINSQHLLLQHLHIKQLEAVIGFSMGGQQAYYWAALHGSSPSNLFVKSIVPICSSARTSGHNYAFLEGPFSALEISHDYAGGSCYEKAVKPVEGLRAFGRAYAAWLTSPAWFAQELWRSWGFTSLKDYLHPPPGKGSFENDDGRDLLVTGRMWQRGDIGEVAKDGNYETVMKGIQARVLLLPCRTDQYFRWEDSEKEVDLLKDGKCAVIESIWGHVAGGGVVEEDTKWMEEQLEKFLQV